MDPDPYDQMIMSSGSNSFKNCRLPLLFNNAGNMEKKEKIVLRFFPCIWIDLILYEDPYRNVTLLLWSMFFLNNKIYIYFFSSRKNTCPAWPRLFSLTKSLGQTANSWRSTGTLPCTVPTYLHPTSRCFFLLRRAIVFSMLYFVFLFQILSYTVIQIWFISDLVPYLPVPYR